MKKRISATIDEETEEILNSLIKESPFRNKSHIIEEAIKLIKEKIENDNDKK